MAEHSPLPWKLSPGGACVTGPRGGLVARCYSDAVPPAVQRANAGHIVLSANAPDLLAALTGLVRDILYGLGPLPSTIPEWHQWEPIIQARAAIEPEQLGGNAMCETCFWCHAVRLPYERGWVIIRKAIWGVCPDCQKWH